MAQLFKNKTLKDELKDYLVPEFEEKMAIVRSWYEAYKNGSLKKKTETQCEQTFNQSFFVEVLGYKSFPSEVYTIDPKAATETGGQKPDAILGYFSGGTKRVAAVVEIKDVNTPLDKSQQREGNLSPIQQAFKYKPQFKDCSFVIATNFFELRLLKDNQLDFERFTLEELVSEKDDYFAFKKFYYLLNAENFVAKSGTTLTEKILSEIRIEQEIISKAFYKEYRMLRQELIGNIIANNFKQNEAFPLPLAVEKAQKVIDRIVFICFCEDLGLIPENKLQEVIFHTEKLGLTIPVWDILKGFFTAIDKGSEKLGIPDGYNGELFKEDAELNAFKIEDAICKKFTDFGKYDFAEDLSVNILGHIFEQSISDIEELKSVATPEEMDQAISKRKKDGIFYTPDYIVDYIVKNTLGAYLQEREKAILEKQGLKEDIEEKNYQKRAIKAYDEYQEFLHNVKVLDPACGSGAFLVKVFDYLLAENKRVAGILADLQGEQSHIFGSETIIKGLLQNNIYGVDLNQESVEITKLSLWLKTAHKGEKLVTLKDNIKCGNSLIDNEAMAGIKAFDWQKEFPEILKNGGFDCVVGNPPWGANIDKEAAWLGKHYPESTKQVKDTYKIFIDKGLQLLRNSGSFGYIVPNTFLYQPSYEDVRDIIEQYRHGVVNLGEKIFENVELPCAILIVNKRREKKIAMIDLVKEERENLPQLLSQINLQSEIEKGAETNQILKKTGLTFEDVFSLKDAGVQYASVGAGKAGKGDSDLPQRLFSETKDNYYDTPFYVGTNIQRGGWIINHNIGLYFRSNYKQLLKENEWVHFNKETFDRDCKIVWRQTADTIYAAIMDFSAYFGKTIHAGVLKKEYQNKLNLYYCLAIFNSSYIRYIYVEKVRETGRVFPQVKLTYLKPLPFVIPEKDVQERIAMIAKLLIKLNQSLYDIISQFNQVLKAEYGLAKIPRKLEKFWELEGDEFLTALKLKNILLQKKQDLLDYFTKNKTECSAIAGQIKESQQALDEEVFDLYKLTPEERATVLQGT